MITLSGYQIVETIYESPNTLVFRARREDGQPVIIKVPSSEHPKLRQLARWRYEHELLRDLSLPGVIRCIALEYDRGRPALVLEDIGARSLRSAFTEAVPLHEFLAIAIPLTEAIGALHEAAIIHKDINPSNVVWNAATQAVQLIDFGIASRLPRETQEAENPSLLEGTLAYISPEQTGRMNRAIDYRTDFYSLGMTFYRLLTGQPAFRASDPMEIIHAHIAKSPAPPHEIAPAIPEPISAIVMKLLSKTAEQRYQSAFGILFDLRACRDSFLSTGVVAPLQIGAHDVSRALQMPQKLFGRDVEVATLLDAFDRASRGGGELILVTGYSGVGKSSLVHEVHKPIVQKRGYFVFGKFDQFRRDIPYESIIHSFRQLIRQVLLESEPRVAEWRTALREALAHEASVLASVLPELELVIGKQPPVTELGPVESQDRFNRVFHRFLGVFVRLDQPLVLFLDDLQWADPASLKLLKSILTQEALRRVLVVGAYRDNEVTATHPLLMAIDEIEREGAVPVHTMTLAPLSRAHVGQFLAEALQQSEAAVRPLAETLHDKTQGNPFFLNQLLTELYRQKLVRFEHEAGTWRWDLETIAEAQITDNVVDLMIARIQSLSPRTQEILKLAACLGSEFDLSLLSIISERRPLEVAADLWEALKDGLVLPVNERYRSPEVYAASPEAKGERGTITYRFLHDRVQQSAYAMIPDDERKAVRLTIGRLLLRNLPEEATDAQVFEAIGHVMESIDLVTDQDERSAIAQVALRGGKRARASLAYDVAVSLLRFAIGILPKDAWTSLHRLAFDLHLQCLECEYLAGHFDEADALFGIIIEYAKTRVEKAEVYRTRIVLYENTSKFEEAIKCGIDCARLFGVELELSPSMESVGGLIGQVKALLGARSVLDLEAAPQMEDPDAIALGQLLLSMTAPAYFVGPMLFSALIAHMVLLSMRHGNAPFSAAGYVFFGVVLATVGDHMGGYEFGQLAQRLNAKFNVKGIRGKVDFMFGNWLNFRKAHAKTDADHLIAAFQECVEDGDLTYASYCCIGIVQVWFAIGKNLAEAHAELPRWLGFVESVKAMDIADNITTVDRAFKNLLGLTTDPSTYSDDAGFDEASFERRLNRERSRPVQAYLYHHKSLVRYIFEDFAAALVASNEAEARQDAVQGQMLLEEHAFHRCLILAAAMSSASPADRETHMQDIRAKLEKLRAIAVHAPMNYAHKQLLVEAEIARLEGDAGAAMDLYDQAIAAASENGYVHHTAIANECAARFHLSRGRNTLASAYFSEAYQAYAQWGAAAKLRQLGKAHRNLIAELAGEARRGSDLLEMTTTSTTIGASQGLDLLTVTKASQAISREIRLDRLLAQLMKILIENAGAERGFIILSRGDKWVIEAAGTAGAEQIDVLRSIPVEECEDLSAAIVQYVARTSSSVVLDNACKDGAFITDAYVARRQVKSLLCLPAVNQGKLVSIVYLENNLSEGCFTLDRIEVLRMLSTQIAISIDHAALYAGLEERVRERTFELRQTQARLIVLERLETERQMAGGFAHEVRNALAGPTALLSQALGLDEAASSMPLANARKLEEVLTLFEGSATPPQREALKSILRDVFLREERLEDMLKVARNSVVRALTITQQILDYAKIRHDKSDRKIVDLNALIREMRPELEFELGDRKVRLDLELDASLAGVLGGEAQLHSVIKNVALNARDALDGRNGRNGDEKVIRISTTRAGGKVQIAVTDNGVGIPRENFGRIFEPFFSTKPETGTGLGLALVKKIVSIYEGEISVRSEVGKGTSVEIILPEAPGA